MHVVRAEGELHVVASYVHAALEAGDDAIVVGVDKRYAQLVSDRVWWYDANKDARYTPEIVHKRFGVGPAKVAEWLALVGDTACCTAPVSRCAASPATRCARRT